MTAVAYLVCPDCNTGLQPGAAKCRCGWIMPGRTAETASRPVVFCDGEGCDKPATNRVGDQNLCADCQASIRRARSEAFCHEQGLRTIDEMRAYCRRLARKGFNGVSFDGWARNMTQRTVDLIAINGAVSDERCLERLRAAGVIDGRNKLIPFDAREVAAAAHRAERARMIVEREPGQDEQEAAA